MSALVLPPTLFDLPRCLLLRAMRKRSSPSPGRSVCTIPAASIRARFDPAIHVLYTLYTRFKTALLHAELTLALKLATSFIRLVEVSLYTFPLACRLFCRLSPKHYCWRLCNSMPSSREAN